MAEGRTMGDAERAGGGAMVLEDFQCPACQRYSETTEKSLQKAVTWNKAWCLYLPPVPIH